ncbi:PTS sugar transporter subunit IIA [Kallotenue papyrolyticum]|uniref:PTS sugar transporter subunit IIA n=1 Tax=Kallotenue papyrolyticum TaxID=1325125 RepID=UPI000492CC6E|nr:PTS sugar transporter subunit IIA [Kallotenue papyrolyticum]
MSQPSSLQIVIEQESLTISDQFIVLGAQPFDDLHAIRLLGTRLEQSGYVRRTFTAAVVERERVLPTGIALGEINLAVPHADAYFAHRSALALATLRRPVPFHNMDHTDQRVPVQIVCLPVVANLRAFSGVLATVLKVLQRPELLKTLCAARQPYDVLRALSEAFSAVA